MKEKIIKRLKEAVANSRVTYQPTEYYDRIEAQISILEDILVEDFGMSYKEVSDLQKQNK